MIDEAHLLAILCIHQSCRSERISLRDALLRSNYRRLRSEFGPAALVPLIRGNPDIAKQWVQYSEDKRTGSGFWIKADSFEVGALNLNQPTIRYPSLEEAVAEFVVKDLDSVNVQ